jgi:hypothetical protein
MAAADNVELLALALAGCAPSDVELKLFELAVIFAAGAVWCSPRMSDLEACAIGQRMAGEVCQRIVELDSLEPA